MASTFRSLVRPVLPATRAPRCAPCTRPVCTRSFLTALAPVARCAASPPSRNSVCAQAASTASVSALSGVQREPRRTVVSRFLGLPQRTRRSPSSLAPRAVSGALLPLRSQQPAARRAAGRRSAIAFASYSSSQVVINYASGAERALAVVAEVKAAGGEAIAVGGSVAKARGRLPGALAVSHSHPQREEVVKLFADTVAAYGKVDIVVNNAGGQSGCTPGRAMCGAHPAAMQASRGTRC